MSSFRLSKPVSTSKEIPLNVVAWLVVLLVSDLPNAIWAALAGNPPAWLFWLKAGLLAAVILASLAWARIRALRTYFILLLALMLALWGMNRLMATPEYIQWQKGAGWVLAMVGFQAQKLGVTAVVVAVVLLLGRRRPDFYLAKGNLQAEVEPVRWLGITRSRWSSFGPVLALVLVLATLLFFGLSGGFSSLGALGRGWPLLAAAGAFAAINAFNEEMQFRAPLLGPLNDALGKQHAIWLTAVFFGFSHYFGGSPSGAPGVLITSLLGFFFAKAMLETRGLGWGWFIHSLQNWVIFSFGALSAIS